MPSFPKSVEITEEGPREGFQFEKAVIPTKRKVELIDRLAETGVRRIQVVSFVNPKTVPGMADADEVVRSLCPRPDVAYTALWLNRRGFERALAFENLTLNGTLAVSASEKFLQRNQNRTIERQIADEAAMLSLYRDNGVAVEDAFIMAAFGCNFQGEIEPKRVVGLFGRLNDLAQSEDCSIKRLGLGDTMGWANPESIKRLVGLVRDRFPDIDISLHLHDTRGLAIANAYAGLQMGVRRYDAAVGGLGGCPFAGHHGAAGNVSTEELVFLCDELGIETGVDLAAMIECARLAENIVQHPLPSAVMKGGRLARFRSHG